MLMRALGFGATAPVVTAAYLTATGGATLQLAGFLVAMASAFAGLWLLAERGVELEEVRGAATRRNAERTARVVGAFLVVGAAMAGTPGLGMVGTASASFGFQDCGPSDSLVGAFISSFTSPNDSGTCRFNPDDPDVDVQNVTNTDAYAAALSASDQQTIFEDQTEAQLDTLYDTAWLESKAEVVECVEEGANRSECVARADNESDAAIGALQSRVINQYDAQVETTMYWANISSGVWYADDSNLRKEIEPSPFEDDYYYQTADNRTVNYSAPMYTDTGTRYYYSLGQGQALRAFNERGGPEGTDRHVVEATNPNNSDVAVVYNMTKYYLFIEQSEQIEQRIDDNIETYVNGTYNQVNNGTLNATELALESPTALASQASSDLNSTGYHSYAATSLAALGINGDLNASHTVNTTYVRKSVNGTNRTYNNATVSIDGTLLYTGDDGPTVTRGETYNPDAYNGTWLMTVSQMTYQNGTAVTYSDSAFILTENFTVVGQRDTRTGETVNATTMTVRDYTSTDPSDLENESASISKVREEYLSTSVGGASGIGPIFTDGSGNLQPVPIIIVAGLLLLVFGSGGGGGTLNIGQSD
jgi:hypothetical protein